MKKLNQIPFFSYVGGKRWLKEPLKKIINKQLEKKCINTYIEPFMGGLGSFFSVEETLNQNGIKNIILNDINKSVYSLFYYIMKDHEKLLTEYLLIEKIFENSLLHIQIKDKTDLIKAKNVYMDQRKKFNAIKNNISLENAATFLFLQNHCFNGFYRENSKGEYNTAFNWSNARPIYNSDKIDMIREVFSKFNIEFKNVDYKNFKYNNNQLVYIDPPYLNEIRGTEVKYSNNKFDIYDITNITNQIENTNFIFSHYLDPEVISIFQINFSHLNIENFERKNSVSGKAESRGKIIKEMIIYN